MRLLYILLIFCFSLLASPPKVVVFDYGGVVANIDRKPMLEFLSESLTISYKKVKKDFESDELYIALLKGADFWDAYAKRDLPKSWYINFEKKKREVLQYIPNVQEIITQMKEQGIQVALLSNTNTARGRFIENLGGYDQFDPILLSCHLGVAKPHPKAFEKLLSHLSSKPEECLFIDNKRRNVRAGKKQGIKGIVFDSSKQLCQALKEHEITVELSE